MEHDLRWQYSIKRSMLCILELVDAPRVYIDGASL